MVAELSVSLWKLAVFKSVNDYATTQLRCIGTLWLCSGVPDKGRAKVKMVLKDVLPLCIQMRGDLCKSLRVCFVKSFQFRQGTPTQYQRLFNACHLMLYYLSISINHLRISRPQYFPHKHIANLKRDLRSSPDLNSLAFKTC